MCVGSCSHVGEALGGGWQLPGVERAVAHQVEIDHVASQLALHLLRRRGVPRQRDAIDVPVHHPELPRGLSSHRGPENES